MNGHKGLTIVVVALLLTICVGFLFNAEQQATDKTVYEDKADLSALMAINSGRENLTEEFNTAYNQTAWYPAEIIPTTTAPNQYIIPGEVTGYTTLPYMLSFDNVPHLTGRIVNESNSEFWQEVSTGGVFHSGNTYPDGTAFSGGIWGTAANADVYITKIVRTNGTDTETDITVNDSDRYQWGEVTKLWGLTTGNAIDGTRLYMSNFTGTDVTPYKSITASATYNASGRAIDVIVICEALPLEAGQEAYYFVQWNKATDSWDYYHETAGGDELLLKNIKLAVWAEDTSSLSTTALKPTRTDNTYADPSKLVNLPNVTYSTPVDEWPYWSNTQKNDTIRNAELSVIVKGSVLMVTAGATVNVIYSGGVYTVNNENVGTFDSLLITMNAQTETLTIEGIISVNPSAPALDYTLAGYKFTQHWTPNSDEITKISFRTLAEGYAYIARTVIYSDPNNLLWVNWSLDLDSYFNSVITAEGGARMIFNGFVTYGTALTVNGQTFPVSDGKITITYNGRATSFKLDGMAIEYHSDNTTWLIFTNDGNKSVSLGATIDYVVSGAGAWYFSSHVLQIKHIIGLEWVWVTGWTLSFNQTCLIMLGFIGAGLLIGLYFGRGSLDSMDWFIIIISAVAAFSLMVV